MPLKRRVMIYAASAMTVAVALFLRLGLRLAIEGSVSAFLLFLGAVMVSAWFGGKSAGFFATGLSALVGNFFFMVPYWSFGLGRTDERIEFVVFIAAGTVVTLLAGQLQRMREAALASQLENRKLEKRILEISDAEHRRIGHDLHDGLGQHLTGITFVAKRLQQRLSAEGSPYAEDATTLCSLARTAVEWTHDLSRSLSPPVLEREGLAEAIRELVTNAERIFGITCVLACDGEVNFLDVSVSVHLYRIVQEAISNAVKHGKARHVAVKLFFNGKQVILAISDDGSGFALTNDTEGGMGLQIMRYRAKMIGASVEVEHRNTGGTAITCRYNPTHEATSGSDNGKS